MAASKRGSAIRGRMYDETPGIALGTPAAGQFRDANAWRVIVDWSPIPEATRALREWKTTYGLREGPVPDMVKVEFRSENGGEMRALASPEARRGTADHRTRTAHDASSAPP